MLKKSLASLLFILLLLLIGTSTGYSAEKFIVRVIYFKAQEADPVNHEKYNKIMKDTQDFFRNEMIRHGYGDKTFKLETEPNGDLKIHTINGKHPGEHYTGEIFLAYYEKMSKEIPFHINNTTNRVEQDNIYLIIVGGVPIIPDGRGSPDGSGWIFASTVGGGAMVNENYEKKYPNHFTSIIAHELTHAFGIKHNEIDGSLMGSLPFGGPSHITDFEARLLNKHHIFNDVHILNDHPEISDNINSKAVDQNTVRFEFNIKGSAELYHAQLSNVQDYIGSAALEGRDDIAEIDVPRRLLANGDNLDLLVYDVNGNRRSHTFKNVKLPENVPNKDSTFKFLTIRDPHPDSITPFNNSFEWVGWENAGIFEKPPNGPSPQLPNWYIHVPKLNEWNSWFYSHAIARFVYDISAWEFNRFEAYFYLPNPCNQNTADVEVICFADDVEIYRSEILRHPAAQNKHFLIDIPKDTKKFTIEITDAGDGIGCDHFVFGEAKVLVADDDTNEDPKSVNPKSKLVLTWAKMKTKGK